MTLGELGVLVAVGVLLWLVWDGEPWDDGGWPD